MSALISIKQEENKMANVSVKEIKELMTATGVGMMDCKKALVEADGDMERQF